MTHKVEGKVIEVHLQPGVMDPVAASAEGAIREMGFQIDQVRTGRRYELSGNVNDEQRETIAKKLLANAVIEDVYYETHTPAEIHTVNYDLNVVEVPIRDLDEAALMKLSTEGDLFLNIVEMRAIQDYFKNIGREPQRCGTRNDRPNLE